MRRSLVLKSLILLPPFVIAACERQKVTTRPAHPDATTVAPATHPAEPDSSATSPTATLSPSTSPSQADEFELKECALLFLMPSHSAAGELAVIQDDRLADRLAESVRAEVPTAVSGRTVKTKNAKGRVVDMASGRPVVLWRVSVAEMKDGEAVVSLSWAAGGLAAEGYTLHLRRTDGKWAVVSGKTDWAV